MVFHTSHTDDRATKAIGDLAEVSEQVFTQGNIAEHWLSVFCRENEMDPDGGE